MTLAFRALTTDVSIELDDDVELAELAHALVSTYAPAQSAPSLTYKLSRHSLVRDGAVIATCDEPEDVVPRFEMDMYEQLIARAAPAWLLHGAGIEIDGGVFAFAGPSGAGKTTLALELVRRGHRLLTEEILWLDASGTAYGLARPLHVVDSDPLSNLPSEWPRLVYPIRTATNRRAYNLVVPPRSTYAHGPLPLRALVRLTHGPDRETQLTRLSGSAALQRFWDPTFRNDDAGLAVATTLVRTLPAYVLATRTFAEALAGVDELLSRK